MYLYVDSREPDKVKTSMPKFVTSPDEVKIETLPAGDFWIVDNENQPICIIERKSVSDLSASICDGRFAEQRNRLLEHADRVIIVYIIEGSLAQPTRVHMRSLCGSLENLTLKYNIRIIPTGNKIQTMTTIASIFQKFKNGQLQAVTTRPSPVGELSTSTQDSPVNNSTHDSSTVIMRVKSKMQALENVPAIAQMLVAIPGVSSKLAMCISEHYTRAADIVLAISQDRDAVQKTLSDISVGKRRVSKTVVERIIEWLS